MGQPDEVFCMSCGPGTVLDADPGAHRLRCPRCGAGSWLPALPLFVVTGASGTGDQVERLPARKLIGPIHVALLDCPDEVLAGRLRARPAWRGTSSPAKITENQRFAAWLRARVTPSFDTSTASPAEVAGRVAAWVTALFPGLA